MITVEKIEKIKGTITAPPSKSYTHRAVICASLADGTSEIISPLNSADCLSSVHGSVMFGAEIDATDKNKWIVVGNNNSPKTPNNIVDIGNSGTTLRILTGIASQIPEGYAILTGDSSIITRPMQPLLDALNQLGITAFSSKTDGTAPIIVKHGEIKNNVVKIRGDMSSQFITSLMMTLPFSKMDSTIELTTPLKSAPYLDITIAVLDKFGIKIEKMENIENGLTKFFIKGNQKYKPCSYTVEGDCSSASYFIAVGVLMNSDIVINNIFKNSKQGDREIVNIVKKMGAPIIEEEDKIIIKGPYKLKGIDIDVKDTPDLVPTIAVLGCFAEGTTTIYNGEHVRLKECDRLMACAKELTKMGAKITEKPDGLIIEGVGKLKGAEMETYHDHRLVMAFTVAGMMAEGKTIIKGEDAVKISFPNFVEVIKSIGANITIE
jgi:3-phosphoshikimate 1-carboxyvinyltransferase